MDWMDGILKEQNRLWEIMRKNVSFEAKEHFPFTIYPNHPSNSVLAGFLISTYAIHSSLVSREPLRPPLCNQIGLFVWSVLHREETNKRMDTAGMWEGGQVVFKFNPKISFIPSVCVNRPK